MIQDPMQDLGQRLLACEPTDAQLAQRYRDELSAMLHRGPGTRRRVQIVTGAVLLLVGLGQGPIVWWVGETVRFSFVQWMVAVGGAYMAIMGLAMLVLAIRRIDPRRHRALWFGLAALHLALLAAALLAGGWTTDDPQLRWQLSVAGFVLLGILGVSAVVHFVEEFHRRTELRLLNLEYRLADLAARLERP